MTIPAWILEGSNGAMAVAFAFVLALQVAFLVASYTIIQDARSFYRQMKPVIALTVMAAGLLLRFADVWAQRHGGVFMLDPAVSVLVHVGGSFVAIVGVLCWLRVTMPRFCGRRAWLLILAAALAVFIAPALL